MNRTRSTRWLPLFLMMLAMLITAGGVALTTATPAMAERGRAAEELDLDDEDFDDEDHDEEEEWDEDWDEYFHEVELYAGLLELITRMSEVSSSAEMSAVAAVMNVEEFVEDEEQMVSFLTGLLPELSADNPTHLTAARAIRIKLAEVYGGMDRPEEARAQLRLLILGQPLGG